MRKELIELLTVVDKIRSCAYQVRLDFMPGYLENVYQNALMVLLTEAGLVVEREKTIHIIYHGKLIGEYRADLVVENSIILELKAVASLLPIHEMQLVNYLQNTGMDMGLIINYGSEHFSIKSKFRTPKLLEEYKLLMEDRKGHKFQSQEK